jgi:hypothetical protein
MRVRLCFVVHDEHASRFAIRHVNDNDVVEGQGCNR